MGQQEEVPAVDQLINGGPMRLVGLARPALASAMFNELLIPGSGWNAVLRLAPTMGSFRFVETLNVSTG